MSVLIKANERMHDFCVRLAEALARGEYFPIEVPPAASEDEPSCEMDGKVLLAQNPRTCVQYLHVLTVMQLVQQCIKSKSTISLRDVYYTNTSVFSKQAMSDAAVRDVGNILRLSRYEMGIVPVSKGYVAGALRFRFRYTPSNSYDAPHLPSALSEYGPWRDTSDVVLPGDVAPRIAQGWTHADAVQTEVAEGTTAIVVVEKEGIFHRLVEDGADATLGILLVTGCGMPDIATRSLLNVIVQQHPRLRVLALCDYNPYGMGIFCCYKYGSTTKSHHESTHLILPMLMWVGLRPVQVARQIYEVPDVAKGLHPYTARDISRLQGLLNSGHIADVYKQELREMGAHGYKCELEALFCRGLGYMTTFLEQCLVTADYI